MRHSRKSNVVHWTLGTGVALAMIAFAAPRQICAESVTIAPHKIVLNAKGQFDDVQAIVSMTLPAGYVLADFDVRLWFDDVPVAQADAAFYCYVDDNLIVSFDRAQLQANPDVVDCAGSVVEATVEGSVTGVSRDGDEIVIEFAGTDSVEIVKPGR